MRELENGNLPETRELLSAYDRFNEIVMVGLRTKWGVSKEQLFGYLTPDGKWYQIVRDYEDQGLLVQTADTLVLTPKGRLLADGIASDLFLMEN